jgi:hypothetical protein
METINKEVAIKKIIIHQTRKQANSRLNSRLKNQVRKYRLKR